MSDGAGSHEPIMAKWERGGMRRETTQRTSPITDAAIGARVEAVNGLRRRNLNRRKKVIADTIIYAGQLCLERLTDEELDAACAAIEAGTYPIRRSAPEPGE